MLVGDPTGLGFVSRIRITRSGARGLALLVAAVCLQAAAAAEPAAETSRRALLRYALRPGDHLVYRQVLERRVRPSDPRSTAAESSSRVTWRNHLLVIGGDPGARVVGVQRNRVGAELLSYRQRGRDRLERERSRFAERLGGQSASFTEANLLSEQGRAALPWKAERERISEVLRGLHEIEPLPAEPVGPGDQWPGAYPLGLSFRAVEWEQRGGGECLRVEGTHPRQDFRMGYRFCARAAVLDAAWFEGSYPGAQSRVTDRWEIELVEVRRDESLGAWLADPQVRLAALEALTVGATPLPDPAVIYALLAGQDPDLKRRVLALAYRHRLPPPAAERLSSLLESGSARLRVLAVRLLERIDKTTARPLIELALDDPDGFVRAAAVAWVRSRVPEDQAPRVLTVGDARSAWDLVADAAPPIAADPPAEDALPGWVCADQPGWSERIRRRLRFAPQVAGTTWRRMSATGLGGWGYSIYVPEDYRGDEPFPLLIYLAGGEGRPLQAVAGAQATISELGYLVAFPQADGYWWTEHATRAVTLLLDELLRQFNVDTNRVYLSGFSNGGTGAIHFASLWPHRLAAGSSLMGAGAFPPQGEAPLLVNLSRLPTQWLHGRRDEVIPWQTTRDSLRWLERVAPGAPAEVHYLERGHDLWLGNDGGLLIPFLERHRRDPFPREVRLQLRDLAHPRSFWLEVLEKGPGTAEVHGRIENDNTIVISTRRVRKLRLLLRRDLLPTDDAPLRVVLDGRTVHSGPLEPDCARIRQSWSESADPFLAYSAELRLDLTGDR